MDAAFRNATHHRDALRSQISTLEAQIDAVRSELTKVEQFLTEWSRFAQAAPLDTPPLPMGTSSEALVNMQSKFKDAKRPKNPTKEEVGDHVAALLEKFQKPIGRARLFEELTTNEGIVLHGANPSMVLSTMLWRMQDRFTRYPGKGYWFAGRPLPKEEHVMSDSQDNNPNINEQGKTSVR